MRDPVLLPSSKTIVDRSTIKQHYLSDPTDPFNRMPLRWEDIVEATELKGQIQAFLVDRRSRKHVEPVLENVDGVQDAELTDPADRMQLE